MQIVTLIKWTDGIGVAYGVFQHGAPFNMPKPQRYEAVRVVIRPGAQIETAIAWEDRLEQDGGKIPTVRTSQYEAQAAAERHFAAEIGVLHEGMDAGEIQAALIEACNG